MCLDLRHSGNFLSDSLRVGRAFGVFLVKGIKVLAAPVLSGHFAWVRDLRILQLDLLSVLDGSEWRVELGRSSGRMTVEISSRLVKIADLVVLVAPD
ncbi:hypothetical protein L6452_16275 [Arctium lappa]|uniref:Uncharacterized protein n=1 Tax=Arctium lappa TaxID=4217 RepID=A0ACB9C070_ARCLA|nr:hypothetical protein L6452_16275 [Arctium lappa]